MPFWIDDDILILEWYKFHFLDGLSHVKLQPPYLRILPGFKKKYLNSAYCTKIFQKIQKRKKKTFISLIKGFQQNLRSILWTVQRLNDGDDLSCVWRQASF